MLVNFYSVFLFEVDRVRELKTIEIERENAQTSQKERHLPFSGSLSKYPQYLGWGWAKARSQKSRCPVWGGKH